MNISLTRELDEFVTKKVKGGSYHTASEVIRDALRLLIERDHIYQIRLQELHKAVKEGLDSGGAIPAESVYRELRRKITQKRTKRI
jgi:antitoxin ParD1/3/4